MQFAVFYDQSPIYFRGCYGCSNAPAEGPVSGTTPPDAIALAQSYAGDISPYAMCGGLTPQPGFWYADFWAWDCDNPSCSC